MYAPKSKWTAYFLGISVLQSLIILVFEFYIFAIFQNEVRADDAPEGGVLRAVPTFLSLCSFAFLYQPLLVYDALRRQNIIQVLGLVGMNLGLVIYGGLQIQGVLNVVLFLLEIDGFRESAWPTMRILLIMIPCVLSLCTIALSFVAWKLWREFAWAILRLVSADLTMRQRYLNYQIFLTLLKFGFFYYLGFIIQLLVIVQGRDAAEIGITAACLPVTVVTLVMATTFTKRESMVGMAGVMALFLAGLAFFIFKLVRMYQPQFDAPYVAARRALRGFAALTVIVLLVTIVYGCLCMSAFGKGLKHFVSKPIVEDDFDDDDRDGFESMVSSYHSNPQPGPSIEMVSNLRARLSGYQRTESSL